MRHIALSIALSLAALPSALAQTKGPEVYTRGEVEELKGVSRLFVGLTPPNAIARDRIIKAIRARAPHLSFVPTQEEADVWLWLSTSRVMETNRTPPNPSGQQAEPPAFTYESAHVADGMILVAPKAGRTAPSRVGQFRGRDGDLKGLCESFAKEFVRLYRKANSGKESATGKRPRAENATPRLAENEEAAPRVSAREQAQAAPGVGPEGETGEDEVVRINSTLVTIPASVMNRDGKYVTNLRREDFRVYEDGVEQDISFFEAVDAPFTVALLIDTSDSTRAVLKDIVAAANAFVDQLRPDDRLIVISFDYEIRELLKATKVREVRNQGLKIPLGGGTTRLYDAVDFAVNERLKHLDGRKAIVLLTDGVEGGSNTSHDRSLRDIEESDVLIYTVRYDTFEETLRQLRALRPGRPTPDQIVRKTYERGQKYLNRLAQLTGGRSQEVEGGGGIAEAFASVVGELGRQYSLGYYPRTPARAGERRQIKVRVGLPNHAVRARDSYTVTSSGAGRAVRNK